ncbi:hypothetical protein O1L60_12590 [Streptomyces diastatochromogenes]|nr:hypothetical protein [Streptomyces diastatochromogenes]
MYAAAPRVAVIPDTVYVWHVRRAAAQLSISLDRGGVSNWESRIAAHRAAVDTLAEAGRAELAAACRTKFLEHDLRMYARDLRLRDAGHRAAWWELTRAHLSGFADEEIAAATAPARWTARFLLAAKEPRDLLRLSRLTANPGGCSAVRRRPHRRRLGRRPAGGRLDGMDELPLDGLPFVVDAVLSTGGAATCASPSATCTGGSPRPGPRAELAFLPRGDAEPARTEEAALSPVTGADGTVEAWTARVPVGLTGLAGSGRRRGREGVQLWDIGVTVTCANGESFTTSLRAPDGSQRRSVLPSSRYGVLLVQPYTTANGSLAVRIAPGARDGFRAVRARLRRLARSSQ